ncbi:MAG: hypothetical protein JO297_11310 [Nitrososphaeraceae archaeon]|nr:hypothetical protein [Nitrososphaeraceae archaeon]
MIVQDIWRKYKKQKTTTTDNNNTADTESDPTKLKIAASGIQDSIGDQILAYRLPVIINGSSYLLAAIAITTTTTLKLSFRSK